MLSFFRKRFPSRARSYDSVHKRTSSCPPDELQDKHNRMKKTSSTDDFNVNSNHEDKKKNKKKKKKEKSSSNQNEFTSPASASPTMNKANVSYSDVDYFPMQSAALSPPATKPKALSYCGDFSSDSYLNPNEASSTGTHDSYLRCTQPKRTSFNVPEIDSRREHRSTSYNSVDHQRTYALRQAIGQRIEKK